MVRMFVSSIENQELDFWSGQIKHYVYWYVMLPH